MSEESRHTNAAFTLHNPVEVADFLRYVTTIWFGYLRLGLFMQMCWLNNDGNVFFAVVLGFAIVVVPPSLL